MEARAIAKYVRMSPMKVGVVLDLIRGKNVNEAFAILQYTPKDAAVVINKVLKSAVASKVTHLLSDGYMFIIPCDKFTYNMPAESPADVVPAPVYPDYHSCLTRDIAAVRPLYCWR